MEGEIRTRRVEGPHQGVASSFMQLLSVTHYSAFTHIIHLALHQNSIIVGRRAARLRRAFGRAFVRAARPIAVRGGRNCKHLPRFSFPLTAPRRVSAPKKRWANEGANATLLDKHTDGRTRVVVGIEGGVDDRRAIERWAKASFTGPSERDDRQTTQQMILTSREEGRIMTLMQNVLPAPHSRIS